MGIRDVNRIYTAPELAPGKTLVFAASGVTDAPTCCAASGSPVMEPKTQSIVMNSDALARAIHRASTHL